jgi:glycosyltransferase involved in cell wall biosynthesis
VRTGLITGEYPPDQGGVGDFTRELARAMAAAGHDVHVITGRRPSTSQEDALEGLTVHRVVPGWGWGLWHAVGRVAASVGADVLNIQFQTAAYRMHPAINLLPPWFLGHGSPRVVVTFHDLRVPYLFPKAGPLRWQAVWLLARRSHGVIVTNREDEVQLCDARLETPLVRIPIGSNIAPHLPPGYDRHAARARWGVGPGDLLLAYFGFLNERKGGEDLVETLALLVERGIPAHLLLIGGRTGTADPTNLEYARRVDALIARRGVLHRVHRTGFVSPEEVSASLTAADVCVLPYRDGVSLRHGSLHACLAHGRPIVTTRPSIEEPDLQDGENALIADAGDVGALANATAILTTDLALRHRLASGAKALAESFTWDRIAASTVEFFAELAA